MIAPVTRITIIFSALLTLAACAPSESSSNNASVPVANDGHLHAKTSGVKNVLIGRSVDLRTLLLNYEGASFKVTQGQQNAEWTNEKVPRLHFKQVGKVTVECKNAVDKVVLTFQVKIDTTGAADDLTTPGTALPPTPFPDL